MSPPRIGGVSDVYLMSICGVEWNTLFDAYYMCITRVLDVY